MDPFEMLQKVNSKSTFLEFLEALSLDRHDEDAKEKLSASPPYAARANGWENGTVASYLEAMHAFGCVSDQVDLSWKGFATLLYAGKIYE